MELTEKTKKRFLEIFRNKGNIGPIAEKAKRNFEIIKKNEVSKTERIYHFAVGHAFRNIDKSIFENKIDEIQEELKPTKFLALQKENFLLEEELFQIIESIRDCNSHYVHTFDRLKILIDSKIMKFLKEAFVFSVINNYLKEKGLDYSDFKKRFNHYDELTSYLCDKFYPNKELQKEIREQFLKLKFSEAIDELLFINVESNFDWKIDDEHFVFEIKQGKYLSSIAQLFLISLFLYKHEAEQLISKIRGFKRNDDEYHYKRDVFTFFSKKVASQDIHSEEKYLIRFRDIIQYLNHFPTIWNKSLEPERLYSSMTNELEKYVLETEILRSFPKYSKTKERQQFLIYTLEKLIPHKSHLFENLTVAISEEAKKRFDYEIDVSPELKDVHQKLKEIGTRTFSRKQLAEKDKLEKRKFVLKKQENPVKLKLLKKIEEDKLVKSYGRNQDRFMDFAIRFLAEENYFGKDAKFKLYQCYTTDEQNEFLAKQKASLSKKEFDKLKYHQGKLVHYSTYVKHLEAYPNWDTPFVIENNAVQIILKLSKGEEKLFSIQRKLLIYLLEDAFYNSRGSIENKGKELLESYFYDSLLPDFDNAKSTLVENNISTTHRKLLPKRLLYNYQPAIKSEEEVITPFQKILQEAEQQEKRYELLYIKAKDLGLEKEFLKRNKGKQFKLRFIRKVWHLMYFKEIYREQAERQGHHKSFHITKEEFNNFSKWMFAFDEVPQYKGYLSKLFVNKKFIENNEFASLFEQSTSLEDLYNKTKNNFDSWIQQNQMTEKPQSSIENYQNILSKNIVYINISHFISYLESINKLNKKDDIIQYSALSNSQYLIGEYYYKDILPQEEYKVNNKLFNKLRTVKLEDMLLYELAMKYLNVDDMLVKKAKSNVRDILSRDFTFDITNADNKHLYNLILPFNKIESLAVLIQYKTEQELNKRTQRTSFLGNIFDFLSNYKGNSTEVKIISELFNKSKELSFDDLNKINNYIISGSIKFSKVQMELERYFILKNGILIGENYIDVEEIKDRNGNKIFRSYYDMSIRRKAYHFGVPMKEYEEVIKEIEKKFVKEEVKPLNPVSFSELDKNIRSICLTFMKINHSKLFMKNKISKEQSLTDFENKYFDTVING
jgi:hypothetical protein